MKNWVMGVVLVLLGALAFYFFKVYQSQEVAAPPPPATEVATPAPEPVAVEPEPGPGDAMEPQIEPPAPVIDEIPLPMLAESDPLAFEAAGAVMGEPAVTEYLAGDNMISRLVTTVDALGARQVPGAIQAVREPGGNFQALADEQPQTPILNEAGDPIPQFVLDPANYGRYTDYVEVFEAVDTVKLVENYQAHYSLVQEAYRMQGYPEGEFNDRLLAIIDELLATPEVSDPVQLIKPEAYFLFADPELEALSAGQKILLRMGSANAGRVKSKLLEVRAALAQ